MKIQYETILLEFPILNIKAILRKILQAVGIADILFLSQQHHQCACVGGRKIRVNATEYSCRLSAWEERTDKCNCVLSRRNLNMTDKCNCVLSRRELVRENDRQVHHVCSRGTKCNCVLSRRKLVRENDGQVQLKLK
ncbi:hypothetical protein J6590_096158 [Homalodisca vitripennis]|nr:hypothetical protein J6590_096158 [Homalodisca vitripennis]